VSCTFSDLRCFPVNDAANFCRTTPSQTMLIIATVFVRDIRKAIAPGLLLIWLSSLLYSPTALAQNAVEAPAPLPFQTTSVGPERFISVHGRRALVMGYAASGLEVWTYPVQIVRGYQLGFRSEGTTTEIDAATLLRGITYEPEAVTRTYIGPDFIVRERLFVPLEEAAVSFTYTVECRHSVDLVIHFTPVLDLMWPGSIGGQSTRWDSTGSAYRLSEAMHRYSALIGSPGVISHDEVLNSAQPGALGNRLAFALRAGGDVQHQVTVFVSGSEPGASGSATAIKKLQTSQRDFEAEASAHYAHLAANALRIETPDREVNQQLAWAQIALDQAWVCNPVLGCGLVAGYGPSRDARRPQYAWFFAGDALIAIDALLSTGEYDRAREALAFIAKYQDAGTGMIWHELSQSADPATWATRYPYMFVHVDITFHYLTTVERYLSASGDTLFLQEHSRGLEAAYRYCASLLNAEDGLPRIPSAKEGGNEQDKLTDDLDLSASWVAASAAYARLARLDGHAPEAEEAMRASERARRATARRYWDDQRHSWIDGYNESGHAVVRRSDDGVRLVTDRILDQRRSDAVLDQVASSDFQTDWGTRGVAASSGLFDPASYASGSVSAPGTAGVAAAFWSEHRPVTAYPIWRSLLPWGTLDSMGHMDEVLAGDFYHQQTESVPEQTWSSAAFLSSAVHGLLGLTREAQADRLEFSPHLPPGWDRLSIENVRTSGGKLALTLARVPQGLDLETENSGSPVELLFSPEIPLGAHLGGAELDGKPVGTQREEHAQDTHATLRFTVPRGKSHCRIRYEGGVSVTVTGPPPLLGESSKTVKITSVAYRASTLVLDADVPVAATISTIVLQTHEKPLKVRGAKLRLVSDGFYDLAIDPVSTEGDEAANSAANPPPPAPGEYRRTEIVVDFAGREGK
jgi:glycogen debranching enzyme